MVEKPISNRVDPARVRPWEGETRAGAVARKDRKPVAHGACRAFTGWTGGLLRALRRGRRTTGPAAMQPRGGGGGLGLAQRRGSAARPAALQLARVRRWTPTVSFPHSRRLWAVSVALATSRGRARLQFWLDQRIDTELGGTAGRGDNGPTTQSLRRVKARGTPRAVKGAREGTGTTLLFTPLTLRGGGTAAFLRALSSGAEAASAAHK